MRIYLFVCVSVAALFLMGCGATEFSGKASSENGSSSLVNPEGAPPASDIVNGSPDQAVKYACGDKKIAICHVPEGNPGNRHILCLPPPAIEAHLAQHDASADMGDEDYLGECR